MYIYIYISAGKNLSESRWGHDFPWKTHQRRLCRDQEYSRLRMLNRAKRTLPARDSSRNACSLLPLLRGVETAASTRGIIHRRAARDTLREQLDESSRGERASYRSRFRSSTPSSSSVSLPLDSRKHALSSSRGRSQGQVQVHRNHHALTHFSLSLSLPLSLVLFQNSWPEIDLATKGRLTVLYRQFAIENVANWPSRQREHRWVSGRASPGIRLTLLR